MTENNLRQEHVGGLQSEPITRGGFRVGVARVATPPQIITAADLWLTTSKLLNLYCNCTVNINTSKHQWLAEKELLVVL